MEFTGERFIPLPELLNDEIGIEHLHRYHSVIELIKNKTVLDIACGEGYGSAIMAPFAKSVAGVDIDSDCIKHASSTYAGDFKNISFLTGTVVDIPFSDKNFDVVISFETIEHITQSQQKLFLAEVKRVLKDDGILIISTPDKENYNSHNKPINEFHEHELERNEFREILETSFTHVYLFDQGFEIVSLIIGDQHISDEKNTARLIPVSNKKRQLKGKYIIAVSSNIPVKDSVTSVITESTKSYQKNIDRIVELQNEVEARSSWGLELDKQRIQNESVIAVLKEQISQTNSEAFSSISLHLEKIQASLNELNFFKQKFAESEIAVNGLKTTLQEETIRNQILIKQREEEIENLKKIVEAKNSHTDDLKAQIRNLEELETEYVQQLSRTRDKVADLEGEKARMISEASDQKVVADELKQKIHLLYLELDGLKGRLAEIYDSEGWAVLKKYYNLKGWLLYEDSWRYKTLRKFVNKLRNKKIAHNIAPASSVKLPLPAQSEQEVAQDNYPLLEFNKFTSPDVSIIIPVYNGWSLTYRCLQSILANTFGVTYEVVIGDDCSTDETKLISQWVKNIEVVRHDSNRGFLQNCNEAAKSANGKYILFLNNDTEVKPTWLSSLVGLLEKDSSIGMAGSKLIYPDGRLQEAGGIIWKDASGWNYGHKQDPEAPEFNYVKEVDYISGASIVIRSALWKEIGGFDELFSPAYCEDTDLAFMVRQKGYKVVYQPLSELIHHEGSSHGSEKSKAYQQINNKKFREKWQAVLDAGHFHNAENVFWARDRSKDKKTILIIDHYVPHFDKDAGSRTAFQIIELFAEMGYNIKFIGDNFYRHEPYTTLLQQMGVEVLYGVWYRDNWQQWLIENNDKIDFIYLNRPHISIKYLDFLKQNAKAKIVYYGHDLHFVRELSQYKIEKDKKLLDSSEEWKKIETHIIQNSDVVFTLSLEEKSIMETQMKAADVRIIPAFFYNTIEPVPYDFNERKDVLFVGGFNHKPNVDAVLWFVKEAWPLIVASIPGIRFIIVGSSVPDEIKNLSGSSVEIKGHVSDEDLKKLYQKSRLAVIPLRYGAGVKGKTVEAMYYGLPFVSTSFGIEGLQDIKNAFHSYDTIEDFSERVINLYNSEDQLQKMSNDETIYAKKYFSKSFVKQLMSEVFN